MHNYAENEAASQAWVRCNKTLLCVCTSMLVSPISDTWRAKDFFPQKSHKIPIKLDLLFNVNFFFVCFFHLNLFNKKWAYASPTYNLPRIYHFQKWIKYRKVRGKMVKKCLSNMHKCILRIILFPFSYSSQSKLVCVLSGTSQIFKKKKREKKWKADIECKGKSPDFYPLKQSCYKGLW